MALSACRGEYEPASFVVTASKPLDGVLIEVGQLAGPLGRWPKEAVDVRVVKDYWRGVATPTLLVHDESFLAIEPRPTEQNPEAMEMVARWRTRAFKSVDLARDLEKGSNADLAKACRREGVAVMNCAHELELMAMAGQRSSERA